MSKEQQFTPGPWQPIEIPGMPLLWIGEQDGTTIATIALRGESGANSRLITAAPEMYEVLVQFTSMSGDDWEWLQDISSKILSKINNPE